MIGPLQTTLHQTRRAVVADLQVAVTEVENAAYFPARLQPPERLETPDGAPRSGSVWLLVYDAYSPVGGNPVLAPGDRVTTTDDETWEVLSPTSRVNGSNVADALKLTDLYPYTATLEEQGGDPVLDEDDDPLQVPAAVWPAGEERTADTGRYADYSGEIPAEFFAVVDPANRVLVVDGKRLRVTSAALRTDQPRVLLGLRALG